MKSSTSAPLPVEAGLVNDAGQTGGCGGKGTGTGMKWLIAGSILLAIAAAMFGLGWLSFAAVLPFLYLLPCLAMTAMCMKNMSNNNSGARP